MNSCPTAVTRSMYADDALPHEQAAVVASHLTTCASCRSKVAALRDERTALREALRADDSPAPLPAFVPPARPRDLLLLAAGVLAVAAFCAGFWTRIGEQIPAGLEWLNPFQAGELAERAIRLTTFMLTEGTTMLTDALNLVAATLAVALLSWTMLGVHRNRGGAALLVSLLVAAVALPRAGHAFEIRKGEGTVSVPAGETVDDTLLAVGNAILIDGDVTGDLLAFGRSVTIRGNVMGNVVAGAETVTVEGTVGGDVVGAGRGVSLRGSHVGRNFLGLGRDLAVDSGTEVTGNAMTFGDTMNIDGRVGTDLRTFGNNVLVTGNVQRNFEAYAAQVSVLPTARIGGNVTAHVDANEKLQVADGATIGGSVERKIVERELRRNPYLTTGFYVRQIVRIGAAFLVGLLLFWVFPTLRNLSLPSAGTALRSTGIGFVAAIVLPVAAIVACITVVGIPIGILTLIGGAIGLYLSKIVVAQIIGRELFGASGTQPHPAATLIAGLVVVIIAINLPLLGGIVNLVLTLLGFGMLVTLLLAKYNAATATA